MATPTKSQFCSLALFDFERRCRALSIRSERIWGNVNCNMSLRGSLALAHSRPPCASMIARQIERPIPSPRGLVL